ncbi:death-associated protein 1 [Syngnathus acus]|uniref:death-associated protein 1 n=1 Tax=Syngnathus acus TaxID=161584 RepID=UPI00188610AF|nr:death-associated protein 1 [Syngnathus acus]XP_049605642.1 death-associated protein 1 [Syngnathus scovelli]XP_061121946.1 death-associated protein 1 homolog [Syngnathus typhle]
MSSPPKEKIETRGGHPPAVKAGGMRIVQKHQATPVPEPPPKDDDEEQYVSSSPPKAPVIVSGVVTKGDKDFTPAAAQVAHQKPQPGIPKLPPSQHINQHIHQPRK